MTEGVMRSNPNIAVPKGKTRAQTGGRAPVPAAKWLVDGEYLETREISISLEITEDAAKCRLRRARKTPGPLTWAKLGRK